MHLKKERTESEADGDAATDEREQDDAPRGQKPFTLVVLWSRNECVIDMAAQIHVHCIQCQQRGK